MVKHLRSHLATILEVVSVAAVVYGVWLIYAAAAWILAGCVIIAAIEIAGLQERKHRHQKMMADAAKSQSKYYSESL